jgi:hypothetical protein
VKEQTAGEVVSTWRSKRMRNRVDLILHGLPRMLAHVTVGSDSGSKLQKTGTYRLPGESTVENAESVLKGGPYSFPMSQLM